MTEQLNERERGIANVCYACGWQDALEGNAYSADDLVLGEWDVLPPDPNLARITELEAEVVRLNEMYGNAVKIPSHILDRRDDEICRLYAEVARLNGLLDLIEIEIKGVYCSCDDVDPTGGYCEMCRCLGPEIRHILSRRTAERKEPTDASE